VWGMLVERDAVIFSDNDFEIFIDPDGDTHQCYELEVKALRTLWDLFSRNWLARCPTWSFPAA
jgi:hypothetical protein